MPPRSRQNAARPARRLPAPSFAVERTTLANGLRVVLAPDRSAPVVGVAVYYDVGFRSEPEGRTGFAHLFEHLMFQGSASLGKMEHAHLVQGAGGVMNGSTHPDFTNYFEALPSSALELALFLEADRMRSVRLTQENLDNQVAVVQEEIRANVLNRPYGGFPWIDLPPVIFSSFANAHNGYGDFAELESATLDDAQSFFDRYYTPANAVLTIAGDLDVERAVALVEQYFAPIPTRAAPALPSFAEAPPVGERRAARTDPLAPTPAVALGYRVPDPLAAFDDYLAFVVLADVLAEGDASRLQRRLLLDDQIATSVSAYLGTFGDPFDVRDPTLLTVDAFFPGTTTTEQVVRAVDEELDRLATDGPEPGELDRVQARMVSQLLRQVDQIIGRTLMLSVFEQQRGRAELVNELPRRLAAVSEEQVRRAASRLRPDTRAVLEVHPGGTA